MGNLEAIYINDQTTIEVKNMIMDDQFLVGIKFVVLLVEPIYEILYYVDRKNPC